MDEKVSEDDALKKCAALLSENKFADAIKSIDEFLEISPNNQRMLYNKAFVLAFGLENYPEANECCDKLLTINPRDVNVWGVEELYSCQIKKV